MLAYAPDSLRVHRKSRRHGTLIQHASGDVRLARLLAQLDGGGGAVDSVSPPR